MDIYESCFCTSEGSLLLQWRPQSSRISTLWACSTSVYPFHLSYSTICRFSLALSCLFGEIVLLFWIFSHLFIADVLLLLLYILLFLSMNVRFLTKKIFLSQMSSCTDCLLHLWEYTNFQPYSLTDRNSLQLLIV